MRYVEIWNQIKHLIKSKSNNSDNYDEKNIEIKFNSDSFFFFELGFNACKAEQLQWDMGFSTLLPKFTFEKDIKNARNDDTSIFNDGNEYYPHAFFGRIFVKISWVDRYKFWSTIELISLKIEILIKLMTCLSVLFVTTITFWKYFFSISNMCTW